MGKPSSPNVRLAAWSVSQITLSFAISAIMDCSWTIMSVRNALGIAKLVALRPLMSVTPALGRISFLGLLARCALLLIVLIVTRFPVINAWLAKLDISLKMGLANSVEIHVQHAQVPLNALHANPDIPNSRVAKTWSACLVCPLAANVLPISQEFAFHAEMVCT